MLAVKNRLRMVYLFNGSLCGAFKAVGSKIIPACWTYSNLIMDIVYVIERPEYGLLLPVFAVHLDQTKSEAM